jgi:hypothetical protein
VRAIGAFVSSVSNRGQERRTRMLDAANDFIVDTWRMTKLFRNLRLAVERRPVRRDTSPEAEKAFDEAMAELVDAYDEHLQLLGRIYLLFGEHSDTYKRAEETGAVWTQRRRFYEARRDFPQEAPTRLNIGEMVMAFGKAARRDVRFGVAARLRS